MPKKPRKISNFTDLKAWQEGHKLTLMILKTVKVFPDNQKFILSSQIQRAAFSVTSNLAEGFGRLNYPDKKRFYGMAQGSLNELQSHLIIARDANFINHYSFRKLFRQSVTVHKIISGLIKKSGIIAKNLA